VKRGALADVECWTAGTVTAIRKIVELMR